MAEINCEEVNCERVYELFNSLAELSPEDQALVARVALQCCFTVLQDVTEMDEDGLRTALAAGAPIAIPTGGTAGGTVTAGTLLSWIGAVILIALIINRFAPVRIEYRCSLSGVHTILRLGKTICTYDCDPGGAGKWVLVRPINALCPTRIVISFGL
ncbi:MAG: hypothetical protein ACT4O1_16000 [Gemmatimonadota bacterium]